ncbi:MAG: HAD-IA family hydrolase [Candidatus ainarchaeum sp.]|nr:HAD-IA family hydrolase [Candidatus ainarchaeum sp.]
MIKAVLFDAGGVYLKGSFAVFTKKAFRVLGISKIVSAEKGVTVDGMFNSGKITIQEFFRRIFNVQISIEQEKQLVKLWTNNWKLDPKMAGLVKKLKKNYRLGMISNSDPVNFPNHLKKGWLKPFEVLVLSHELGILKPEKEIYEIAIQKLGLKPEECLFIDDQEKCIETAQKLGMKAIWFRSFEQLKKDLAKFGIQYGKTKSMYGKLSKSKKVSVSEMMKGLRDKSRLDKGNPMKLVLFDIDGILLPIGSVEFDYWKAVAKKHFGINLDRNDVVLKGRTDRDILIDHLQSKGVKEPEKDARFLPALEDIGSIVLEAIQKVQLQKIRGVEKLIKRLVEEKQVVGLLTGNTFDKAQAKLKNVGLWKYFKVGAFGDATSKRSELVPIAMKSAKQETGREFKKEDIYIIGDTIRDIVCAKEAGVKSIAVATGHETVERLKKEKPDYLFKDFSNIKKIVKAIK